MTLIENYLLLILYVFAPFLVIAAVGQLLHPLFEFLGQLLVELQNGDTA